MKLFGKKMKKNRNVSKQKANEYANSLINELRSDSPRLSFSLNLILVMLTSNSFEIIGAKNALDWYIKIMGEEHFSYYFFSGCIQVAMAGLQLGLDVSPDTFIFLLTIFTVNSHDRWEILQIARERSKMFVPTLDILSAVISEYEIENSKD
jgi:hypothetical protein